MHSIAWYCMALYGIAWYRMALYGIVDPSYIINASTTSNPHSFNMLWLRNSNDLHMKIMCLYKTTNCKEKERHQDPKLRWFQIEFTTPQ